MKKILQGTRCLKVLRCLAPHSVREGKDNMSRLKELRKYVDAKINKMTDEKKRTAAIAHLYGVSLAATMIAKKRGFDPELCAMAAMLHSIKQYNNDNLFIAQSIYYGVKQSTKIAHLFHTCKKWA